MGRSSIEDARRKAVTVMRLAIVLLLAACHSTGPLSAAERPSRLVEIGEGRQLNLKCTGRGAVTVLLEFGLLGAMSEAWWKVQPQVAKTTRVCSYDRAGYGFSSPGPLPRDGAAIARDLDAALAKAGVKGPFVVVGHSAGGLYARLFAARRLQDVAGLVFVDATPERRGPFVRGVPDGLDGVRTRLRGCLAAAEAKARPAAFPPGCIARSDDAHEVAVAADVATWRNQLSELDEIAGRTSDQVQRIGGLLRNTPAYVLTASKTVDDSRDYRVIDAPSAWLIWQRQLSDSFLQGWQRTVISSHLMMIDRPEVIADAVTEMVRAARANRPPPPLAPADTDMPLKSDKPEPGLDDES